MGRYNNFVQYLFEYSKILDKNAFMDNNEVINYSYLYNKVLNLALYIKNNYNTKENYFLLFADNSIFFVISYFAIISSGNIVIPLHPQTSSETISYIIENIKINTVFVQKKYLKKFLEYPSIKNCIVDKEPDFKDNTKNVLFFDSKFVKLNSDFLTEDFFTNTAVIIFTSGSTGTPKGVMLSHKNLISNTESIIEYLELNEKDIMMEVLPYSYCYGASWLHTITRVGGTHIINNKFMLINRVLNEINLHNCTGFAGVPSHFQMLLRNSKIKEMTFPTLRFVTQAGGKLANVFIEELIHTLPTTQIFIMYGQTEATARLSYLPPEYLSTKLGSIGKGIPNVKLEVLNKQGKKVQKDEIGSIVASGDNIMIGYWKDIEETNRTLINGKLWTGDLARVDEDGFIFIVDREKHFIKSGGHRISPKEIEDHIVKLNYVIECAVIGVPDDLLGEAPKVFLVLKDYDKDKVNYYKEEIINHCKNALASFKVPKYIEFIKLLPKNSSNKVLVNELKKSI
jgi:acyl-CoA synthetase (AMP-forming)/AMP-acid ligase II